MNYLTCYKTIIKKAKKEYKVRLYNKKNKIEYYEKHHIIPKSIMLIRKTWLNTNINSKYNLMNKKWNIVFLTAKEHFICHRLLVKISKNLYGNKHTYTYKMVAGVNWFIDVKMSSRNENLKITSRTYTFLRKERKKIGISEKTRQKLRDANIGKRLTEEHKKKLSLSKKNKFGRKHTEETKRKIGQANRSALTGRNLTEEHKKNISFKNIGKKHTELAKKNMSIAQLNRSKESNLKLSIARSKQWKLYFLDGRTELVFNLQKWCENSKYHASNIGSLASGKLKHYKDIIKVEKL